VRYHTVNHRRSTNVCFPVMCNFACLLLLNVDSYWRFSWVYNEQSQNWLLAPRYALPFCRVSPIRVGFLPVFQNFTDKIQLCKIWGFHGGDYEEWCLLGCYAVWLL
jgi:hypothetical protein